MEKYSNSLNKYFNCSPDKTTSFFVTILSSLLIHDYLSIFLGFSRASILLKVSWTLEELLYLFPVCIAIVQLKVTIWKLKSICQVQKKFLKKNWATSSCKCLQSLIWWFRNIIDYMASQKNSELNLFLSRTTDSRFNVLVLYNYEFVIVKPVIAEVSGIKLMTLDFQVIEALVPASLI